MMHRAERLTCRRAPMPDSAMCSDMQSQDVEVQFHVDAKVCLVLRPPTDNPVSYRPYLRCGYACTHRGQPGANPEHDMIPTLAGRRTQGLSVGSVPD